MPNVERYALLSYLNYNKSQVQPESPSHASMLLMSAMQGTSFLYLVSRAICIKGFEMSGLLTGNEETQQIRAVYVAIRAKTDVSVRQMIMPKRTKTLALLTCVAAVALGLVLLAPTRYSSNHHLCRLCGAQRVVDDARIGPVPYRHKMTITPTAVSQALGLQDCRHDWMLYRFGRGNGSVLFGWSEHADGGTQSTMIPLLLRDEHFSANLAAFDKSSDVWSELVGMIDKDSSLDKSLGRWWQQGSDRPPFATWWVERNKTRNRQPANKSVDHISGSR